MKTAVKAFATATVATVATLAGCASVPTGKDVRPIQWHMVADVMEARATCRNLDRRQEFRSFRAAPGCSYEAQGYCVVVAVKPTSIHDVRELEILGHEIAHCFGIHLD